MAVIEARKVQKQGLSITHSHVDRPQFAKIINLGSRN